MVLVLLLLLLVVVVGNDPLSQCYHTLYFGTHLIFIRMFPQHTIFFNFFLFFSFSLLLFFSSSLFLVFFFSGSGHSHGRGGPMRSGPSHLMDAHGFPLNMYFKYMTQSTTGGPVKNNNMTVYYSIAFCKLPNDMMVSR